MVPVRDGQRSHGPVPAVSQPWHHDSVGWPWPLAPAAHRITRSHCRATLAFQVTEDVTALLVPAEKARSEREALVLRRASRRSWTNATLPFAGLRTVLPTRTIPGVSRPPDRGIAAFGSLGGSVSIARVLTLLVPCCSPLQECFPQKSGYCEKDRRAKILSSPRTSPGEETE